MWIMFTVKEHADAVHEVLDQSVTLCAEPRLRTLLQEVVRGRSAAAEPATPWFMLPIFVCEGLGGDTRQGRYVAAALELGRIAAGCLDEWQDQDTEGALWRTVGPAQAVNAATAMIALSLLTLGRLTELGAQPGDIVNLQREFHLTLLRMCEGQHADLNGDLSLGEYETVAGAKSGALFGLGCQAGAMIGSADPETAAQYRAFGCQLGVLVQAWNDVHGAFGKQGKHDVHQQRGLPVLAALALGADAYEQDSESGQAGRLYSLVKLQVFYQRCVDALARCPVPGHLVSFLDGYSPGRLQGDLGQAARPDGEPHEEPIA
jgi:geranylgeranyl pyrophosphate synthase